MKRATFRAIIKMCLKKRICSWIYISISSYGNSTDRITGARKCQLTLFHHANVNASFETTGLAVTPVVLGDGAASIEWTGEGGFTFHAAPTGVNQNNDTLIVDTLDTLISLQNNVLF